MQHVSETMPAATPATKYAVLADAVSGVPGSEDYVGWKEYVEIQPNTMLFDALTRLMKYPFWQIGFKKVHAGQLGKVGQDYVRNDQSV